MIIALIKKLKTNFSIIIKFYGLSSVKRVTGDFFST